MASGRFPGMRIWSSVQPSARRMASNLASIVFETLMDRVKALIHGRSENRATQRESPPPTRALMSFGSAMTSSCGYFCAIDMVAPLPQSHPASQRSGYRLPASTASRPACASQRHEQEQHAVGDEFDAQEQAEDGGGGGPAVRRGSSGRWPPRSGPRPAPRPSRWRA